MKVLVAPSDVFFFFICAQLFLLYPLDTGAQVTYFYSITEWHFLFHSPEIDLFAVLVYKRPKFLASNNYSYYSTIRVSFFGALTCAVAIPSAGQRGRICAAAHGKFLRLWSAWNSPGQHKEGRVYSTYSHPALRHSNNYGWQGHHGLCADWIRQNGIVGCNWSALIFYQSFSFLSGRTVGISYCWRVGTFFFLPTSFHFDSFLLAVFLHLLVIFQSCCSLSQVFVRTLVHAFHISYTVLTQRVVTCAIVGM